MVALVNLPNSNQVKVLHGLGFGTRGIGTITPTSNKLLVMSGEGDKTLGTPEAICLPATIHAKHTLQCPMDERMQQKLQTPNNSNWHVFLHNQVPDTETVEIMQITPVPAFLVYDGFESDLQAEV
eukprot:4397469-Ditylum_brightwellii.AAC.1